MSEELMTPWNPPEMRRIRQVHFVGIGGSGMSGIAEVILNQGYVVSGSDMRESAVIEHLRGLGMEIHIGHAQDNLGDSDVVVISSAVPEDNPEVQAARSRRIPVIARAEMLAELMRHRHGIAVAGTHGKTTTTSLIASVLGQAGFDPTFVIGGRLNSAGTNAKMGRSRTIVAEADESDASFLHLTPMIAVVTNNDADHMHTYGNDFSRLRQTFIDFLHNLPFYGLAVLCYDDPTLRTMVASLGRQVITYGLHPNADFRAEGISQAGTRTHFVAHRPAPLPPLEVTLNIPGQHNVLNALATIAVAHEEGVSDSVVQAALADFSGVGRRFQIYGEYHLPQAPEGATLMLVDDYGHHPREVQVTFEAIRAGWPERRLVVLFQPHRYTRTRDLYDDFVNVLDGADLLCVLDVYPAGEAEIPAADGRSLCRSIRQRGRLDPIFIQRGQDPWPLLRQQLLPGDLLLTQGAGDIGGLAGTLAHKLSQWCAGEEQA